MNEPLYIMHIKEYEKVPIKYFFLRKITVIIFVLITGIGLFYLDRYSIVSNALCILFSVIWILFLVCCYFYFLLGGYTDKPYNCTIEFFLDRFVITRKTLSHTEEYQNGYTKESICFLYNELEEHFYHPGGGFALLFGECSISYNKEMENTVSSDAPMIINDLDTISLQTSEEELEKIIAICKKYGYTPTKR